MTRYWSKIADFIVPHVIGASVRLFHVGLRLIVSKQLNVSSRKQHDAIAQELYSFLQPRSRRNSNCATLIRDAKYKWGRLKLATFLSKSHYISETVQARVILILQ